MLQQKQKDTDYTNPNFKKSNDIDQVLKCCDTTVCLILNFSYLIIKLLKNNFPVCKK